MNKYKVFCEQLLEDGLSPELLKTISNALTEDNSRYPSPEDIVKWLCEEEYENRNIYDHLVKRTADWIYDN